MCRGWAFIVHSRVSLLMVALKPFYKSSDPFLQRRGRPPAEISRHEGEIRLRCGHISRLHGKPSTFRFPAKAVLQFGYQPCKRLCAIAADIIDPERRGRR